MAGASLLTLIDDISTILDDVAVMSKVALKKTAGVVGDDLALNAQQIVGVEVNRELPVVWAVAKGSALNRLILVPIALAISAWLPWAVTPLLMIGGAYLCYEGCEKLLHKWMHHEEEETHHQQHVEALADPQADVVSVERQKILGAIRTDFVLSAEIIVIALGTVATRPFSTQVAVLATIAVLMTIGVYGLVAAIIKLDDLGLYLSKLPGEGAGHNTQRSLGRGILAVAPWLMRGLSIAGTVAMFTVGGGILTHGVHALEEQIAHLAEYTGGFAFVVAAVLHGLFGVLVGALLVGLGLAIRKVARV